MAAEAGGLLDTRGARVVQEVLVVLVEVQEVLGERQARSAWPLEEHPAVGTGNCGSRRGCSAQGSAGCTRVWASRAGREDARLVPSVREERHARQPGSHASHLSTSLQPA